jgi:hypothetical protein
VKVKTPAPKFIAAEAKALYDKAHAAGQAAAEAHNPTPMVVFERVSPFDDTSAVKKVYAPVMGGVCGFAWISIHPGNSSFARWLAKNTHARKGYYGGMQLWVRGYGQSMEKKEVYADAFARVLREAGVDAYSGSRMD